MRSVLALARVAWLTAASYRLGLLLSLASVLATVVPVFFVSGAVQEVAAASIRAEGGDYFGFIVVGIAAVYIVSAATAAIPTAIAGSIGSGTFEALLVTRTPMPALLAGLSAYPLTLAAVRGMTLLAGAAALGARFAWPHLVSVLPIVALTVLAYGGIGLVAAALVLAFRTSGPLISATVALSGLLGGAYYSTSVVPGWLGPLTEFVPLTHALRATRRLLLAEADLRAVALDVGNLAMTTAVLLAIGVLAFTAAIARARRVGSLSQY